MAAFPDPPYEFNLEHANALGVEFFRTIVTVVAGMDAWPNLNRSAPVSLSLHGGIHPALTWWARTPPGDRVRWQQTTQAIPDWLWELLQTETTAEQIRELAPQHGVYLPPEPEKTDA